MGEPHVIVHIPLVLFGLNLSITNFVVGLCLATVLTFLFLVGAARAVNVTGSGRFPNLVEAMLDFVRENISDAFMGHHGSVVPVRRHGLFLHPVQQSSRLGADSRLFPRADEQFERDGDDGDHGIPHRAGRRHQGARVQILLGFVVSKECASLVAVLVDAIH